MGLGTAVMGGWEPRSEAVPDVAVLSVRYGMDSTPAGVEDCATAEKTTGRDHSLNLLWF